VYLLSSGMIAAGKAAGYAQFIPGQQATAKAPAEVKTRYLNTGSLITTFTGVCALSTPVNAAIQKIRLFNFGVNTTAGTFILKSRPLSP